MALTTFALLVALVGATPNAGEPHENGCANAGGTGACPATETANNFEADVDELLVAELDLFDGADSSRRPSLSMLQRATKRTTPDDSSATPANDVSMDGSMEGPPPDCEPTMRMDIGKASVAYSNLGRMGPDLDAEEGILFTNVLADSGSSIDLLVRAKSDYSPLKVAGNGKINSFGRINIATGTSVSLEFEFQDSATHSPVLMKPFTMSFVDLDEQKDDGTNSAYARESITIMDEHEYILSSSTQVVVTKGDGGTTFSSSEFGSGKDNPKGAMLLTQAQKDKTVQVILPSVSTFSVTFTAGPHPAHWSGSSRNILFAGQTNVWCPPDEPLPTQALCETMECSPGYKLKKKKKLDGLLCESDTCTVSADLATCCQPDFCSKARFLSLEKSSLTRNNLGNQGPDSGDEGMLFEDVFPASGETINMLVSAAEGYERMPDRKNGISNKIAKINLVTGGQADLTFTFLDGASNKPTKVGPFYMSFLDFDEQQDAGKARESLTINNFKKYVLSDTTVVHAVPKDERGEIMTFSSTTFGQGSDNVENTKQMTESQKDKSMSVLIPKVSMFTATFAVAKLPGKGFNSRYIQIAGATNLVCN